MNVLMVTERYIPIWGGAENQLYQLIPHLIHRGCKIEIVTRRWYKEMPARELINGIVVHKVGIPGTSFTAKISFIMSLLWFLLKAGSKADIYHSHGAVNMGALCNFVRVFRRKKNVAKIASAGRIPRLATSMSGKILLGMFKRSSAIISMTNEIDKELADIETSPFVMHTITNGVDCQRFSQASYEKRQEWKNKNNLSSESLILLFSSRLVFGKGLDILIEAWPEILNSIPHAHLLVVGSGSNQPDSVEIEIYEKVKREGLQSVIFAGETEMPEEYLSIADCFIFPSRKEGFPNALMEAMASRLPCVASAIGGVEALITDGENGVLFESENSNDLAAKCIALLTNSEKKEYIGRNARKHMLDHYSFATIAEKYVVLYKSLVNFP